MVDKISDALSYPARRKAQKQILADTQVMAKRLDPTSPQALQKRALRAAATAPKPWRPTNSKPSNGIGVGP